MMKRGLKELMGGLIGPMTAIAKAMSRNYNVRIEPSGFECCTDGNVIKYPFNVDHLQEADQKVVHGILDHEIAHIDEERLHLAAEQEHPLAILRRQRTKRHELFLNIFEDIRIESKKSKEYPGVAENLAAANKNSVKLFRKKHSGRGMKRANFWHTVGSAIILQALGEDISWLPGRFRPYLDVVADEISMSNWPMCRWAADAERLAHSAVRKIEDLAEELRERDRRGDRFEVDKKHEDGESDTDVSVPGAEDGDDAESSESSSEGREGSNSELSDDDLRDACDAADYALGEDADVADLMSDAREQVSTQAETEAVSSGRYTPSPKAVQKDTEVKPAGNIEDFNTARERVQTQISALRAKLLAVVRTRAASTWAVDREEGDIDDGSLALVRTNGRRIFMEEVKGETLDTAISVLVDLSGSMGSGSSEGEKAWHAKHMLIALVETFSALHVPFEVIGFHNRPECGLYDGKKYSRTEPFEFRIFKEFGESHRSTRQRYSAVTGGGNNADGEAVLYIAKRLALRPESRKMLFVLSDGMPSAGGNRAAQRQHLKDVVKMVSDAGIEVLGIGAKCPQIKEYYCGMTGAEHVVIDDLDTLAVKVYRMMRSRFLQNSKRTA